MRALAEIVGSPYVAAVRARCWCVLPRHRPIRLEQGRPLAASISNSRSCSINHVPCSHWKSVDARPSALGAAVQRIHPPPPSPLTVSVDGHQHTLEGFLKTTHLLAWTAIWIALSSTLSACGGGDSAPTPAAPPGTPAAPPTVAYLLQPSKVELCNVDGSEAQLDCVDAGVTGFESMYSMAVSGSHAYIADIGGDFATIIHCRIGESGALSDCSPTGPADLEKPYGLAFGLAVRESTLYIGGGDGTHGNAAWIQKCQIETDGTLGACADAGFTMAPTVNDIRFVGTTVYLSHYNGIWVSKCTVQTNGSFSSCDDAGAAGLDGHIEGVAVNANHMYIADTGTSKVLRCVISDDGSVDGCADAGAGGLTYPTHVVIRDSMVYITDAEAAANLTRCSAKSDGFLTGCTSISAVPRPLQSVVLR